jgi:hypothetical protein
MSMKPGKTRRIEYLHWDGTKWEAELEQVTTDWSGLGATDPDFIHYQNGQEHHRDKRIGYIADDGSHWSAECHSHRTGPVGDTTFTFEHFKVKNGRADSNSDHEDGELHFYDWDKKCWKLTVAPGKVTGGFLGSSPINYDPMFDIQPYPGSWK